MTEIIISSISLLVISFVSYFLGKEKGKNDVLEDEKKASKMADDIIRSASDEFDRLHSNKM